MKEHRTDIGGGYWLVRDKYCCWIMKDMVSEKGNKWQKRVSGFHADIQDALMSVYKSHSREVDARSMKVLIDELKALKSAVKEWANAIEEANNDNK